MPRWWFLHNKRSLGFLLWQSPREFRWDSEKHACETTGVRSGRRVCARVCDREGEEWKYDGIERGGGGRSVTVIFGMWVTHKPRFVPWRHGIVVVATGTQPGQSPPVQRESTLPSSFHAQVLSRAPHSTLTVLPFRSFTCDPHQCVRGNRLEVTAPLMHASREPAVFYPLPCSPPSFSLLCGCIGPSFCSRARISCSEFRL